MSEYDELVKSLRICAGNVSLDCSGGDECPEECASTLMFEAANVIEALEKKVRATEWDETCDPEWRDCNEPPD